MQINNQTVKECNSNNNEPNFEPKSCQRTNFLALISILFLKYENNKYNKHILSFIC